MNNLNWLDFVFLVVVVLTIFSGFFKGFFNQVSSLIILIVSFAISVKYHFFITNFLASYLPYEVLSKFVGFAIIFMVLYWVLSFIIIGLINSFPINISIFDRLLGGLIAFFKIVAIIYICCVIIDGFIPKNISVSALNNSFFRNKIYYIVNTIYPNSNKVIINTLNRSISSIINK